MTKVEVVPDDISLPDILQKETTSKNDLDSVYVIDVPVEFIEEVLLNLAEEVRVLLVLKVIKKSCEVVCLKV